jgi:mercuric ion binding protein
MAATAVRIMRMLAKGRPVALQQIGHACEIPMKKMKTLLAGVVTALILTAPAWASPQTVTLNVSGTTCAACPITVKKALEKVPGVSKVDVRFEKKQVLATFDDAKTNPDALVKATTNAGYPWQPEKTAK